MIEIYSIFESRYFHAVMEHGLRSRTRLVKDLVEEEIKAMNDFERWRQDLLYFFPVKPGNAISWVSIFVDHEKVMVGNTALEYDYDNYVKSIMPLSEYIAKQSFPGEYSHPITAQKLFEPSYVNLQSKWHLLRGEERFYSRSDYEPEVIIPRPVIKDFFRINKGSINHF